MSSSSEDDESTTAESSASSEEEDRLFRRERMEIGDDAARSDESEPEVDEGSSDEAIVSQRARGESSSDTRQRHCADGSSSMLGLLGQCHVENHRV
jgi:hypothetical protein